MAQEQPVQKKSIRETLKEQASQNPQIQRRNTSSALPPGLFGDLADIPPSVDPATGEMATKTLLDLFARISPEIAGLIASQGTSALPMLQRIVANTAISGSTDLARQAYEHKSLTDLDPMEAIGRGALNTAVGEGGRGVVEGVGRMGRSLVRRAINAGGSAKTLPEMNRVADDAIAQGVRLNEQEPARLMGRSVDAENQIVTKYPGITTTDSMNAAKKAKDPLVEQMEQIDRLVPHVQTATAHAARQGSGPARYLAGAGAAAVATPALMAAGLDPQTAGLIGMGVGIPLGASQASPRASLAMGRRLAPMASHGKAGETGARSLAALVSALLGETGGETASAPPPEIQGVGMRRRLPAGR